MQYLRISSLPVEEGRAHPSNPMRGSIYDNVAFQGGVSLPPQSFTGGSAVNGNVVNAAGMTDAVLRAYAAAPSGSPTAASLVVTLQESTTGNSGWTNALDNTGTVIGFTLTPPASVTGTTASGSPIITAMSSVTGLYVGQPISGTGIPSGAVITAIQSATAITISANATSSNTSEALTFNTEGEARIEGLGLNRHAFLRAVVTPSFTGGSSPAILGYAEIVMGGPATQLPTVPGSSGTVSNT
jgi:hypothetical protein